MADSGLQKYYMNQLVALHTSHSHNLDRSQNKSKSKDAITFNVHSNSFHEDSTILKPCPG